MSFSSFRDYKLHQGWDHFLFVFIYQASNSGSSLNIDRVNVAWARWPSVHFLLSLGGSANRQRMTVTQPGYILWAHIFPNSRWIGSIFSFTLFIHLTSIYWMFTNSTEMSQFLLLWGWTTSSCLHGVDTKYPMLMQGLMPLGANPSALDYNFCFILCLPRLLVTCLRTEVMYFTLCLAQWFLHNRVQ